jgi:hypothetical protein
MAGRVLAARPFEIFSPGECHVLPQYLETFLYKIKLSKYAASCLRMRT